MILKAQSLCFVVSISVFLGSYGDELEEAEQALKAEIGQLSQLGTAIIRSPAERPEGMGTVSKFLESLKQVKDKTTKLKRVVLEKCGFEPAQLNFQRIEAMQGWHIKDEGLFLTNINKMAFQQVPISYIPIQAESNKMLAAKIDSLIGVFYEFHLLFRENYLQIWHHLEHQPRESLEEEQKTKLYKYVIHLMYTVSTLYAHLQEWLSLFNHWQHDLDLQPK